jgi:curli biogenesis system outer membrane secretion channel CsgG
LFWIIKNNALEISLLKEVCSMKKMIFIFLGLLVIMNTVELFAAEKPRIGVLRFTNITRAYWWSNTTAAELQDLLINELATTRSFQILERKELGSAISEQQLSESGLVDSSTKIKSGKIKGAEYLIAATISAFEENTTNTGGGINYRGYSFGGEQKTAYIAIDLKVIDAETGEIADCRTVEANSSSGGMSLSGPSELIPGLSGGLSKQAKTPVGKAIRACIIEAVDYLECSMVIKDDECMSKYVTKEMKRRDKTKSSILLDE